MFSAVCLVGAFSIGYLLATSYLVLRDDLIGATTARQARMQQAYEDRISALRAQVDRITSRQLLDQQLMETKVTELVVFVRATLANAPGTVTDEDIRLYKTFTPDPRPIAF